MSSTRVVASDDAFEDRHQDIPEADAPSRGRARVAEEASEGEGWEEGSYKLAALGATMACWAR